MNLNEIYEYADEKNYSIYYFPMKELVSIVTPDGFIGIDVDKLENTADELACITHEIGHLETGSFYNIYSPIDIRSKHEAIADHWSIKKLIPKNELIEVLSSGICEIWDLAEYFNLPEDFIIKALKYYSNEIEGINYLYCSA